MTAEKCRALAAVTWFLAIPASFARGQTRPYESNRYGSAAPAAAPTTAPAVNAAPPPRRRPPIRLAAPRRNRRSKPEELEQIVAPIALYPDSLLAQIFMASTYPLEIVQADRWVKQNPTLKDSADALNKLTWDPSVKSLINFPQVLTMMSEKLDWTVKLGDAFIADQKTVMDAVQRLRNKAYAAGNLKTTNEQTVSVQPAGAVPATSPAAPAAVAAAPAPAAVPCAGGRDAFPAGHRGRVGAAFGSLRADLQPDGRLRRMAVPRLPALLLHAARLCRGRGAVSFGVGVAVGAAWGHAWGNCNWGGGDVDIDVEPERQLQPEHQPQSVQSQLQQHQQQKQQQRQPKYQRQPDDVPARCVAPARRGLPGFGHQLEVPRGRRQSDGDAGEGVLSRAGRCRARRS